MRKNVYNVVFSVTLKDVMANLSELGWSNFVSAASEHVGDDAVMDTYCNWLSNMQLVPYKNLADYEPVVEQLTPKLPELADALKASLTEGFSQADWDSEENNSFTVKTAMGEFITVEVTVLRDGVVDYGDDDEVGEEETEH